MSRLRFKRADGLDFGDSICLCLGDVAEYRKSRHVAQEVVYVSTEDLLKDIGGISKRKLTEAEGVEFFKGDILLGNIRPYLKKIWLADCHGVCSADVLVIRSKSIDPSCLFYMLASENFFRHIADGYKGSKMPRGDKKQIMEYKLNIPKEMKEQQKIAAFFTALDKKIEINKKILSRYKVIQKVFIDNSLRSIKVVNVKIEDLENIVNFVKDYDHYMPPSVEDGVPYVMTSDFVGQDNKIDFEGCKKISLESYLKLSKKFKIAVGDIIFARYATVGAVRVVEEETKFIVSYSCAVIRPDDSKVIPRYLYYYIKSKKCQKDIERSINAGTQRNVGIATIKKLSIEVPSLAEQKKIVSILSKLDEKITLLKQRDEALTKLKKAFMQQMFV